jgi:hypothetical protein
VNLKDMTNQGLAAHMLNMTTTGLFQEAPRRAQQIFREAISRLSPESPVSNSPRFNRADASVEDVTQEPLRSKKTGSPETSYFIGYSPEYWKTDFSRFGSVKFGSQLEKCTDDKIDFDEPQHTAYVEAINEQMRLAAEMTFDEISERLDSVQEPEGNGGICTVCGKDFMPGDHVRALLRSVDFPEGSWGEPVVLDDNFQKRIRLNKDKIKRRHIRCDTPTEQGENSFEGISEVFSGSELSRRKAEELLATMRFGHRHFEPSGCIAFFVNGLSVLVRPAFVKLPPEVYFENFKTDFRVGFIEGYMAAAHHTPVPEAVPPRGWLMVPESIHPLDQSGAEHVVELLRNPPKCPENADELGYYDGWWNLLTTAAAGASKP